MNQKTSNYDTMRDQMEAEFSKYNQKEIIKKFELANDLEFIYVPFIGREYRIHRKCGRVEWFDETTRQFVHANYNETMTIFDVLCYSKPGCTLSGEYTSVNNLDGVVKSAALGTNLFAKEAKYFEHKCNGLKEACVKLGGITEKIGDVSYRIPLFDFMPIILQFWDADEEYDATLKIMWDKRTLDFMHYETTYFAVSHLIQRLKEL